MSEPGGPLTWAGLQKLGPIIAVAIIGGLVNFYQKVKSGKSRPFNFVEVIGELVTSALSGVLMFWLCRSWGMGPFLEAAFVAMAGHSGARLLFVLENVMDDWLQKRLQLITSYIDKNKD